jgi:hypothetical protein
MNYPIDFIGDFLISPIPKNPERRFIEGKDLPILRRFVPSPSEPLVSAMRGRGTGEAALDEAAERLPAAFGVGVRIETDGKA